MTTLSVEAAIDAVRGLARELGLEVVPEVLADRSNLVLSLAPTSCVARVAMATSASRVGMEWIGREVAIARHLAASGAFVTRPAAHVDPGPFVREGLVISLWERETLREPSEDHALAGARLAEAHRALRSLPAGVVPEWGAWSEARAALGRAREGALRGAELSRVLNAWDHGERVVASAASRTASLQAVHGDAHLGNVLWSERGPIWTDWEDAFIGPVEWDIACLLSKAELFGEERDAISATRSGYDEPLDEALVQDLALVRNLQVIPWLAVFAERQPELVPRMRARIERLPIARGPARE